MEQHELKRLFDAREQRRHHLAHLPIEEKIRAVVRLQEMAAPILRNRGKAARCWKLETTGQG